MAVLEEKTDLKVESILKQKKVERRYRLTPYIVTITCEGSVSEIDLRNFLEAGLHIVRFKMTHTARKDKVVLISSLQRAITWCYNKYEDTTWAIAISIDLPNACIRTGYLKEEISDHIVYLGEDKIVELTSDVKYWNQCDDQRIFIDDAYTLETIKPNAEISINFGAIIMICTTIINNKSIQCKVIYGGYLSHGQFVCIRGIKLVRPTLTRLDKQLLAFVKEYELDMITLHCVRTVNTIAKVRAFFKGSSMPMILSTICEQEGLDNLDEIINESDAIILEREFLHHSIRNPNNLISIQLYVSGKCRQMGKPFYISGNVLEKTLRCGTVSGSEVDDVTNAVMQGAGLVLKSYTDANNLLIAINLMNSVCKVAETIALHDEFWKICLKLPPPVTAADASILSCALTARQSRTCVIVVLTVTGRTSVQLTKFAPDAIILSVSACPRVAKQLQLYRGIRPIVYDKTPLKDWYEDMSSRIQFAVDYGLRHDFLRYKQTYVILRKAVPTSAFCDQVSLWEVLDVETKKKRLRCPEHSQDYVPGHPLISTIW